MRAVASHFKGGERRFFSSGDKRDKEGDRETTCFCKCLALCDLTIRKTRKSPLFLLESRPYFSWLRRKPPLFLPAPGVREIALGRKPPLFLPAPGVREIALEGKPPLFLPAPGFPQLEAALISPGPRCARNRPRAEAAPISPGSWNPISRDHLHLRATLPLRGPAAFSRASVRCRG
jgi:hypothetical protein